MYQAHFFFAKTQQVVKRTNTSYSRKKDVKITKNLRKDFMNYVTTSNNF